MSVEPTTQKHHNYTVERKEICVPRITLPRWADLFAFRMRNEQSCKSGSGDKCPTKVCNPAARCGYVKVVNVLKKHEYECDTCGYKWHIEQTCDVCP
jgi:hypothetical protein